MHAKEELLLIPMDQGFVVKRPKSKLRGPLGRKIDQGTLKKTLD